MPATYPKRRLPPPAATTVYELTDWGHRLEATLSELGGWGASLERPVPSVLSATSVLLYLQGAARADASIDGLVIRLVLSDRVFSATVRGGQVVVVTGEPAVSDGSIACDPDTFNDLLGGALPLAEAVAADRAQISGADACEQLVNAVPKPADVATDR